jgi:hypothetical protein
MEKKIIGVTTITGGDALVYDDGSIVALIEVSGEKGHYFVRVPVPIGDNLAPEDAGNADYSELPGYKAKE